MIRITAVTGRAGTGKTTWLMEKANELTPALLTAEHHSMLAITRMHGSRRRLQEKLRESCPSIRCAVSTIDGFALSILSRWRTTLGYSQPIYAVSGDADFSDGILGIDADFARVLATSVGLLESDTVRRVVGATYPLILIDEFQDCHGGLLEFVKALSKCASLLLAADDFQCLDIAVRGCPGIQWVESAKEDGDAELTELATCHRTSVADILDAACCLRENVKSDKVTIPVICCPKAGAVAWKIIEAIVLHHTDWQGSTALICPSHDPFLEKVLDSCEQQLCKRKWKPVKWFRECAAQKEHERIRSCLGLHADGVCPTDEWTAPVDIADPAAVRTIVRTCRYAKLRGLHGIPQELVARHVEMTVHEQRAYCAYTPRRLVTTVHGAKNREFDNVIILWTYKLPPDQEQQRRLLYNAVTRAKSKCVLLVLGDVGRAQDDPVLGLLGPAQPAFSSKSRKKQTSMKKAKK